MGCVAGLLQYCNGGDLADYLHSKWTPYGQVGCTPRPTLTQPVRWAGVDGSPQGQPCGAELAGCACVERASQVALVAALLGASLS